MVVLGPLAAACAWCDVELDIEWAEITACGDAEPRYVPGKVKCPTPGCVPRCPSCHGQVGDIHGPNCGEVMAAKLGGLQPCTITRGDCGDRMAR